MSFCNSRTGTLRGIGGVHIYYYLNMCLFHKGQKRYVHKVHAIYRLYKTNFKNILELQAKQHCQFSPFSRQMGRIGSAVQLVHSSKMAPRILFFSIAMGATPLYQLKSIATQSQFTIEKLLTNHGGHILSPLSMHPLHDNNKIFIICIAS